ncbi:MAG: hypothetical protein PHF74_00050 [Dehalococcoidales bacterium]|nr:hypothetical protein [Dehalococcoidales bacterium]
MKKELLISVIVVSVLLPSLLITACDKTLIKINPEISEPPENKLTASYIMDNGRSYSISGTGSAMPGEKLDYTVSIYNNEERWQLEYYILLVDSESIIEEVCHDILDIHSYGGMQKPFKVTIPESFTGGVGLYFIIPEQTSLILTISDAITTGWPDVSGYQY